MIKCKGGKKKTFLATPAFLACLAVLQDLRAL